MRWGTRFTTERRLGGQVNFKHNAVGVSTQSVPDLYGSHIANRDADVYAKVGIPLPHVITDLDGNEVQDNVAVIVDFEHFDTDSYFGLNSYHGHENSITLNLRTDLHFASWSSIAAGIQGGLNFMRGSLSQHTMASVETTLPPQSVSSLFLDERLNEREIGVYAEWNITRGAVTVVVGLRGDYNNIADRFIITPRAHVKWNASRRTTLRTSIGTGYRTPRAIIENIGMLATGYNILIPDGNDLYSREQAFTTGGSITQTFRLGQDDNASISLDFFHTALNRSLVVTQEPIPYSFLLFNSSRTNTTDTWQVDLNWSPVSRLDILATARFTHSRLALPSGNTSSIGEFTVGDFKHVARPLMSRFKGLLNISYSTRFKIWAFDVTAQLNGSARVPVVTDNTVSSYNSPVYAQLFAQVTHKIGQTEVYLGCENITGYRQPNPIIGADNPYDKTFNSANVWGPMMGRKFYAGIRWNIY